MRTLPVLSGKARWAVPAGIVSLVAAVAAVSAITAAQAAPALPKRTPAQLLAELAGHLSAPPPLTGTVVETASLGVPQLPDMADQSSLTSLLAGSHTIKIWYADPAHVRLAVPVTLGETDFIRNGPTAWLWQSSTNSVTEFRVPFRRAFAGGANLIPVPSPAPVTPQQAARQVLAAVGPTTRVSVESNVTIAGQAAYELVLAPKDRRSLVGKVTFALDGQHPNVPLRVQVFARGAASPAFQVGYTSLSFVRPAAANFTFTPPAGASVHKAALPAAGMLPGGASFRCAAMSRPASTGSAPAGAPQPRVVTPGTRCPGFPQGGLKAPVRCVAAIAAGSAGSAPANVKKHCTGIRGWTRSLPPNVMMPGHALPGARCTLSAAAGAGTKGAPASSGPPSLPPFPVRCPGTAIPHVYGKGWLSVAIVPAPVLPAMLGQAGNAAGAAGQAVRAVSGKGTGPGFGAILGALMQAAHPVHGAWGSGRLIRTSLLSVLITSNGPALVGAVTPQVLYAAAAQAK